MARISDVTLPNGTKYDIGTSTGAEYIRGTWTEATNAWTGATKDSELYDGKEIVLYLPFAGTSSVTTLNLTLGDGTTKTGAKNVYFNSNTRHTTQYGQHQMVRMVYHKQHAINGTNYEGWWMDYARDTNDNANRLYLYTATWKTDVVLHRYQLMMQVDDQHLTPMTTADNDTSTTKTLTTKAFRIGGPIYFYNNANDVAANANIPGTRLYQQGQFSLKYSFNTGDTLTANKAVYLVLADQGNGTAKLHTAPITQTLPTTDDGLLYRFLGIASNDESVVIEPDNHPIYWYRNGHIELYSPDKDYRYPLISDNGILIPEGADLNDYMTPGTYYSENIAKSVSLSHCPVTGSGFKMYVHRSYIDTRLFQIIIPTHAYVHMRFCYGTSWSVWHALNDELRYGTCDTAAATAAKEATFGYNVGLTTGLTIRVKFNYSNNVADPTLSINGETAKPIYRYGTTAPGTNVATSWPAGAIVTLTYDGTGWILNDWSANDNNYDRQMVNGASKAAAAITAGTLVCGTASGYEPVGESAAFDISYPVMYVGTAMESGSTRNDFYQEMPFSFTKTNGGTSPAFTPYKAVYLKGKLNGSTFTCDSTTFWTQTVPTTADGFQYYLLGTAYSATNMKLIMNHQIFEYSGGKFHTVSGAGAVYTASSETLEFT